MLTPRTRFYDASVGTDGCSVVLILHICTVHHADSLGRSPGNMTRIGA